MKAISACPHHGYENWDIVNYFYDGLTKDMKQLLESSGDLWKISPQIT